MPKASRSKPSNLRRAPIRGPLPKRKKKFESDDEDDHAWLPTIFVVRPGSARPPPAPKPIVSGPIEGCHGGIKVKFQGNTFLTVPPCLPPPSLPSPLFYPSTPSPPSSPVHVSMSPLFLPSPSPAPTAVCADSTNTVPEGSASDLTEDDVDLRGSNPPQSSFIYGNVLLRSDV
ncbi:hypothetical protein CY34DRAFT_13773 [Suillus luteus UH-Slu-Lm8-n1]|uniref:Uncharacterized protein n=1 Tax=Suillus luteus UH-Slu-Lm8-n1 TaxID=930992 RepID=A0A0D0B9J0_9AGAM|nr:hypothetical protein CY34DRAFT_13773 [Suillus luteus UH-Slu-Lm8-n1]